MEIVGRLIIAVLKAPEDSAALERVSAEVRDLCGRFPVPGHRLIRPGHPPLADEGYMSQGLLLEPPAHFA